MNGREEELQIKLFMFTWLDTLIGCADIMKKQQRMINLLQWAMKRRGQVAVLRNTSTSRNEIKWAEEMLASDMHIFTEDYKHCIRVLLFQFMRGVKEARNPNWVETKAPRRVEIAVGEIETIMQRAFARRQCAHALLLFARLGQRLSLNRALLTNTLVTNSTPLT